MHHRCFCFLQDIHLLRVHVDTVNRDGFIPGNAEFLKSLQNTLAVFLL